LAPGSYLVSIDTSSSATFLSDSSGADLPNVSFQNGTITILPEPGSMVLLVIGMLSVAGIFAWRGWGGRSG
jgi:hypothetical protein